MPRVGAQPLKGSPALCHVKTCSGKMGKPFLCIPSFWFQCRPTATTQKAGFNLSTHHEVGDWASICHPFAFLDAKPGVSMGHFIVAALGNHTSSHTLFQNGPLKRQGWHQGMQKDGRCWLNHQLHGGLKGWGQPFYSGSTWKSYK